MRLKLSSNVLIIPECILLLCKFPQREDGEDCLHYWGGGGGARIVPGNVREPQNKDLITVVVSFISALIIVIPVVVFLKEAFTLRFTQEPNPHC
jgi:prolipoprotein diacylglyceryltransferase